MEHDRILEELSNIKETKLDDYEFLDKYFKESFIPWLDNHINTMDTVTAGYFDMIGLK
jgi:hemerythrin